MPYLREIVLAVAIVLAPTAANATGTDAVGLFDALCLSTGGDLKVIEKMVLAGGGKPIPNSTLEADQAVARDGGRGFKIKWGKMNFAVAATSKNACSVMAQGVSAVEVRKLLESHYPLEALQEDRSGTQVATMWKIARPSRHAGHTIVLIVAKPEFGVDALSIGFLPANAAKGGVTSPDISPIGVGSPARRRVVIGI